MKTLIALLCKQLWSEFLQLKKMECCYLSAKLMSELVKIKDGWFSLEWVSISFATESTGVVNDVPSCLEIDKAFKSSVGIFSYSHTLLSKHWQYLPQILTSVDLVFSISLSITFPKKGTKTSVIGKQLLGITCRSFSSHEKYHVSSSSLIVRIFGRLKWHLFSKSTICHPIIISLEKDYRFVTKNRIFEGQNDNDSHHYS